MSRFYFTVALLAALFSLVVAETLMYDQFHVVFIELPTINGPEYQLISHDLSTQHPSPYCLYVSVNDGDAASPVGDVAGEQESFYFTVPTSGPQFGDATLINQSYSQSWQETAGDKVAANMGSVASPNNKKGMYEYCFTIPVLGVLKYNITYINSGTSTGTITENIVVNLVNRAPQVVGDPQFVGLRGQSYQVHGIDGAVYNIVSEPNTQVNSRFVFLTEGQCPIINGRPDSNCWSHPGSYLGEMSFQAIVAGKVHAALIEAGSAQKGFAGVQMDGKALSVGDLVSFGAFSVEYVSSHLVAVNTENFSFQLSNSDMFINQALRATTPLSKLQSHGLLGQTHTVKTFASSLKYIEGEVDDYVVQDGNIFGSDFLYNQFSV